MFNMSIWITDTIESCIDKVIDNRGKNPKNYLTCGQYPVIDNFLIQNEKYPNLCNVTRYLDKDLFNNFLRNYLEKDDVIITLVGNGIGNVSMSPSADVAIVQNTIGLVKLIANIDIDKSYFYSLLKYSNFSDEVKNHANGANVLHLNPQNIEQFELVVADKSTRDSFGNIVKQIYDEIDILYLKNETLKQTRDLLLPRLISGEIDVENMEIK